MLAQRGGGAEALIHLDTAFQAGAPLLTRNVRAFSRIPGLEIATY
jgi:hypothetical protein